MISEVLQQLDSDREQALARLCDLLRFPSISTDPAYGRHINAAAKWLADDLTNIGFEASVRPAKGHPMVVGHYVPPGGAKLHILFYGHYDVQPPDPVELWHTDPFDPQIVGDGEDAKVVARGASDDKGQLMTFIEASRAWMAAAGRLPVEVTVLLEGEEECNSIGMASFLTDNAKELGAADVAFICDTGLWDRDTPAIIASLRGMMYDQVTIEASNRDLHSGEYGGAARNPINLLAKIIGEMHDDHGRITIPNFYDGVDEVSKSLLEQWSSNNFDRRKFLGEVGLEISAGERDYSMANQLWARPTLDANGIWGGYTGEGSKTVIPAKASAKISCRLVGNQDPEQIQRNFRKFITDRLPRDCSAKFIDFGGAKAVSLNLDNPVVKKAGEALADEWGKQALFIGCGGSIPVAGQFKDILDLESVMFGFSLADDGLHSPNEKYNLQNFFKGARVWARLLAQLGDRV